jgi:hypothetical protein
MELPAIVVALNKRCTDKISVFNVLFYMTEKNKKILPNLIK